MKKFVCGRLQSGMSYYLLEKSGFNSYAVFFPSGSYADPVKLSGLAHTSEHTIVHNTSRQSAKEVELILRRNIPRGCINIRTDFHSVAFGANWIRQKKNVWPVLRLIADCLKDRNVNYDVTKIEKGAVALETTVLGNENISEFGFERLRKNMFSGHPFERRIDAELADLENITHEHILRFARTYFRASNGHVVIIGPPVRESLEIIKELFGDWTEKRFLKKIENPYWLNTNRVYRGEIKKRGMEAFHLLRGFYIPKYGEGYSATVSYLVEILEFRLHQVLRNEMPVKLIGAVSSKAGTYHPSVFCFQSRWHGLLAIWSYHLNRKIAELSWKEIHAIIRSIAQNGVTPDEFAMARFQVEEAINDFLREDTGLLVEEVIRTVCNLYPVDIIFQSKLKAMSVTPEHLQILARQCLKNGGKLLLKPA